MRQAAACTGHPLVPRDRSWCNTQKQVHCAVVRARLCSAAACISEWLVQFATHSQTSYHGGLRRSRAKQRCRWQVSAGASGARTLHQLALPAHDVLPRIAQLLQPHGLDQEIHRPVGDPPQHHVRVAVGRHHCAQGGALRSAHAAALSARPWKLPTLCAPVLPALIGRFAPV